MSVESCVSEQGEQASQAESGLVHVTTFAETAMINSHVFESLREKSTIPRHPDGRSGAVAWSCSRANIAPTWKSLLTCHLCTLLEHFCRCSGVSSKQTWTGMFVPNSTEVLTEGRATSFAARERAVRLSPSKPLNGTRPSGFEDRKR